MRTNTWLKTWDRVQTIWETTNLKKWILYWILYSPLSWPSVRPQLLCCRPTYQFECRLSHALCISHKVQLLLSADHLVNPLYSSGPIGCLPDIRQKCQLSIHLQSDIASTPHGFPLTHRFLRSTLMCSHLFFYRVSRVEKKQSNKKLRCQAVLRRSAAQTWTTAWQQR